MCGGHSIVFLCDPMNCSPTDSSAQGDTLPRTHQGSPEDYQDRESVRLVCEPPTTAPNPSTWNNKEVTTGRRAEAELAEECILRAAFISCGLIVSRVLKSARSKI